MEESALQVFHERLGVQRNIGESARRKLTSHGSDDGERKKSVSPTVGHSEQVYSSYFLCCRDHRTCKLRNTYVFDFFPST